MMPLDDLRVYLPKYLSAENYDQLISQLRDFPANIDKRMFFQLNKEIQRESLRQLLDMGASVRQLQRLTGLGRGLIQRL